MSDNISDLIKTLEAIKKKHGDLPVRVQTLSHLFKPEPTVRDWPGGKVVIVND